MSAATAFIRDLFADVLYGGTKELLRVLLAGAFTTLLLAARERTFFVSRQQQLLSILKVAGAVTLMAVLLFTLVDSVRRRCDESEYLCGFIPWLRVPAAPPPPRGRRVLSPIPAPARWRLRVWRGP